MRRVVAGTDRSDVEPLHHREVLAGEVLVERPPAVGMRLMAVHAVEHDALAVHEEAVAPDLDRAEAEPERDGLARGRELRVVETRRLRRPRLDGRQLDRRDLLGRAPDRLDAQLGHAEGQRIGGRCRRHLGLDAAGAVGEGGAQPDVLDPADGAREQVHRSEDPRQPPLVLVLDVARGRPLVDPHDDEVPARSDHASDVELLSEPAAGADADLDAVHPEAVPRLHSVEAQHHRLGPVPRLRHLDGASVVAGRILVGHERRLGRERVLDVRVRGSAVAAVTLEHPVRGHPQQIPVGVVERLRPDGVHLLAVRQRVGATGRSRCSGQEAEAPLPVERERRRVGVQPGTGRASAARARTGVGEVVGARRGGRHFTEPSVRPPRQKRCSTIMAMASGMIDSSTPPVVSS